MLWNTSEGIDGISRYWHPDIDKGLLKLPDNWGGWIAVPEGTLPVFSEMKSEW
jgi:hypothetical protein